MWSRTLSSVLRSRTFIPKTRQFQPLHRVARSGLGQQRFYAPSHDDPFGDDDPPPAQHELLNRKLRDLVNRAPASLKVRYIRDGSPDLHPTPDDGLHEAIFKPTTLPYTVGTDICHIRRIELILKKQIAEPGYVVPDMPRFCKRVLHPIEARYSGWKNGRGPLSNNATFIGGRWAAKEAIIKAFSAAYPDLDKIFMHDIVILNSKVQSALWEARQAASRIAAAEGHRVPEQGLDQVSEVTRGAPRAFVRVPLPEVGWVEVSMSISHDGEYATATALVPVDPKIARAKKEKSLVRGVIAKTYTDERFL